MRDTPCHSAPVPCTAPAAFACPSGELATDAHVHTHTHTHTQTYTHTHTHTHTRKHTQPSTWLRVYGLGVRSRARAYTEKARQASMLLQDRAQVSKLEDPQGDELSLRWLRQWGEQGWGWGWWLRSVTLTTCFLQRRINDTRRSPKRGSRNTTESATKAPATLH